MKSKQKNLKGENQMDQKEILDETLSSMTEDLSKKIEEQEAQIKKLEKEVGEWKTKANNYLNTASYYKSQAESNKADFDRYKERNKNIESDAKVKAEITMAKKIIPILDDFNSAMSVLDQDSLKGFIMIYSSLFDTLKELGVIEINPKGEKLDPEKHNCLDITETQDESLDGTISKVYQKGYIIESAGVVVRPATVSVYKHTGT